MGRVARAAGAAVKGAASGAVVEKRPRCTGAVKAAKTAAMHKFVPLGDEEARGVLEYLCSEAKVKGGFAALWEEMTNNEHRHNTRERCKYIEEEARQVLMALALYADGNPWKEIETRLGVRYGQIMNRCRLSSFSDVFREARRRRKEAFSERVVESMADLAVNGDEIPVVDAKGNLVTTRKQRSPQAGRLVMEASGVLGGGSGGGGGSVNVGGGTGNVFNIVLPERMSAEEFARTRKDGVVVDAEEVSGSAPVGAKRLDFGEGL